MILPEISVFLLFIFNNAITQSYFPINWKIAKVIPVPKIKKPTKLTDFRPISILPCLSKCFEIIIKNQITNHLQKNSLLCLFQSGFRSNHSTTTALMHIVDDIRKSADINKFTVLALLYFSKAFDSIKHDILYKKLISQFKFSNSAAKFIMVYLSDRSQMVEVNDQLSTKMNLSRGVPQGSVLGPLIFSLYINDVADVISHCKFHLYADDLQVYLSDVVSNEKYCIDLLNDDLASILEWSNRNSLTLNTSKSQAIAIYRHQFNSDNITPVILDNIVIPYSNTVRNLGLIMDSTLKWHEHVKKVCKTVYGILRSLWRLVKHIGVQMRHKLFVAYILPHFLYCDVVLFGMHAYCFLELKMLFNACARFVFNVRKFDHISRFVPLLVGSDLKTFLDFRASLFLFKCIKFQQPTYLFNKLEFSSSIRSGALRVPSNSTRIFNSSLFVQGIVKFNKLPMSIKTAPSTDTFKCRYYKHFNFQGAIGRFSD